MGLVITRAEDESYYLIVCKPLNPGDYVKINKSSIRYDYGRLKARDLIDAPDDVLILRREHIEECGGLENVIRRIKEGRFYKKGNKYVLNRDVSGV